MTRPLCLTLAFAMALASGPALAQDFGLDLTEDEDTAQPEEPAPRAEVEPAKLALQDGRINGELMERVITQEDRVKSVQRKLYLKNQRFEVAPFLTVSINDPYYTKLGGAVRASYFLADTLAVAARFTYLQIFETDDVRLAKRNFSSRILFSVPQWSAMGNFEWSPLYGKVAIFNDILHFDGYVLGGLGVMTTEARGSTPAMDMGGGMRFVVRDFLAINVALINTSYVEQPANTSKAATQNMLTLNAGISIFYPFRSTGREAE